MIEGFPNLNELGRTALDPPGADRITFWDHSLQAFTHLRAHTGLSISGTDLIVSGLTVSQFASQAVSQWTNDAGYLTSIGSFGLDDLANTNLPDPNADRIVFWDDSAGQYTNLTTGASLSISGTTLNTIQAITTASSPQFTGLNLSGLTASRLLSTDGSKNLASVGNLASWVAGTTNQISVANDGDGSITLSTPQNLHTAASPTFAGMTIGSLGGVLRATSGVVSGSATMDDLSATSLADPNADRMVFWDDSDGQYEFLTPGTGLSITGNTMNVGGLTVSQFSSAAISQWTNDAGYLTSESDPVFGASAAASISSGDISNWDDAFGWGNHASAGYLTNLTGFDFDDLDNTNLADPNADKLLFWDDGAGEYAFLEPNDGLAISGTNLNVTVTAPIVISSGNVALDLTATYGWSGPHTFAAASVFNEDVTFDGATAGRDVVWDRSDNAMEWADNTEQRFGAGGLTGALGCDAKWFSDGTVTRMQIESPTGAFGTNPGIQYSYFDWLGAGAYVTSMRFTGTGGFSTGIGVLGFTLYIQDTAGSSDGTIYIAHRSFPGTADTFIMQYKSASNMASVRTSTAGRHIGIQDDSSAKFVGFHTPTPTIPVDFNADVRIRTNENFYFGGSSASDFRGLAVWNGTTFDVGMPRHPTANTAGSGMQLYAGGATSGATDKNGGTLTYKSGIATGNGGSQHIWQAVATGQGAGTTDRNPATVMTLTGSELEVDVALNHDGATCGFLGATPAAQQSHVADPSGGSTVDSEARTAINAILTTLETFGFHATS